MRDYSEADFSDASVRHDFLRELQDAERAAHSLERQLRHDVTNAAGAARNAVLLMEDRATTLSFGRLVEIARRNSRTVAELLARAAGASGGNERNDLGRASQSDHGDTVGF